MSLSADQIQMSKYCGAAYREAQEIGAYTNAFIVANNADQLTFIAATAAISNLPADSLPVIPRLTRAVIYDSTLYGIGDLTNTNLPSTTTVAALIALTQVNDTNRMVMVE
jgi:hypothetical protein